MREDDMYFIAGMVFIVIWLLGVLWHPFGPPNTLWHVTVLGTGIVLMGIAVYYLRANEKVDDLEKMR